MKFHIPGSSDDNFSQVQHKLGVQAIIEILVNSFNSMLKRNHPRWNFILENTNIFFEKMPLTA